MTPFVDLGTIRRPLLVCGGAYGNLEALKALDRWALLHGFAAEQIIHTGDAVAYCADAAAACAFLRAQGWYAIKGNVEEQLANGGESCACGYKAGSVCDALSDKWFGHVDAAISDNDRAWMAGLPLNIAFNMNGRQFLVVHGAPERINRFMFESLDEAEFTAQFDLVCSDAVIAGHTGIPFTRQVGERVWHNSGALGLPANDGTPRVWCSSIAPAGDGIRFQHHAIVYDHEAAAGKLRSAGLPSAYADCLLTGRWPSLESLPDTECERTGHPLAFRTHGWRRELQRAV